MSKRAKNMGMVANMKSVFLGMPKKDSNFTSTKASKNEDRSAPAASISKSFLGLLVNGI